MKFEKRATGFKFSDIYSHFSNKVASAQHSCDSCFVSIYSNLNVLILWNDPYTGKVFYLAMNDGDGHLLFPTVEEVLSGGYEDSLPPITTAHLGGVINAYRMDLT